MGQRLTLELFRKYDNYSFATIYYHWSGYTISAITEIQKIYSILNVEDITEEDSDDMILCVLENELGIHRIKEEDPDSTPDRNTGMYATTEEGQDDLRYWSEMPIRVNVDDRLVTNAYELFWQKESDFTQENLEIYLDQAQINTLKEEMDIETDDFIAHDIIVEAAYLAHSEKDFYIVPDELDEYDLECLRLTVCDGCEFFCDEEKEVILTVTE